MFPSSGLRDYAELISDIRQGNAVAKLSQYQNRVGLGRIGLGGALLGTVWGVHLALAVACALASGAWASALMGWSLYGISLATFHLMEFFMTAAFNPDTVSYDSYLINHSKAYVIAAVASWAEFWFEIFLAFRGGTDVRMPPNVSIPIGICLVLVGQFLRSLAMWTARHNFNHIVQDKRKENHVLVTTGVYRFLRHPSYVGFFYWSVGTQFLLGNPFCTVAYAVASWQFFRKRIPDEERYLCERIFPEDYPGYIQRTYMGIPLIRGYTPPTRNPKSGKKE